MYFEEFKKKKKTYFRDDKFYVGVSDALSKYKSKSFTTGFYIIWEQCYKKYSMLINTIIKGIIIENHYGIYMVYLW